MTERTLLSNTRLEISRLIEKIEGENNPDDRRTIVQSKMAVVFACTQLIIELVRHD